MSSSSSPSTTTIDFLASRTMNLSPSGSSHPPNQPSRAESSPDGAAKQKRQKKGGRGNDSVKTETDNDKGSEALAGPSRGLRRSPSAPQLRGMPRQVPLMLMRPAISGSLELLSSSSLSQTPFDQLLAGLPIPTPSTDEPLSFFILETLDYHLSRDRSNQAAQLKADAEEGVETLRMVSQENAVWVRRNQDLDEPFIDVAERRRLVGRGRSGEGGDERSTRPQAVPFLPPRYGQPQSQQNQHRHPPLPSPPLRRTQSETQLSFLSRVVEWDHAMRENVEEEDDDEEEEEERR